MVNSGKKITLKTLHLIKKYPKATHLAPCLQPLAEVLFESRGSLARDQDERDGFKGHNQQLVGGVITELRELAVPFMTSQGQIFFFF